jgi:diadenosine tetraphosphatase ApaH/serine/threonine PP2A family protein phosphatase
MSDVHDIPRISLEWTDQQLSDEEKSYLGQSGVVKVMDGFSLVHSSMRCPTEWRYIFGNNDAYWNHFSRLVDIQSKLILNKIRVCFIGHTHQAQAFSMKIPSNDNHLKNINTLHPPEGIGLPTLSGYWYLFNVGSVGQPRDGNKKACYVTFDDTVKEVTYHRVDYDIQKTQAQIRKAGLPERLAERLDFGK